MPVSKPTPRRSRKSRERKRQTSVVELNATSPLRLREIPSSSKMSIITKKHEISDVARVGVGFCSTKESPNKHTNSSVFACCNKQKQRDESTRSSSSSNSSGGRQSSVVSVVRRTTITENINRIRRLAL